MPTHGLPLALSVDYHAFFYTHNPDAFTQLGAALHFCGIQLRSAPTPQAKGKIERRHDDWQKRLVPLLAADHIVELTGPTNGSTNSCPTPTNMKSTVNSARPRTKPTSKPSPKTLRPPARAHLSVVAPRLEPANPRPRRR